MPRLILDPADVRQIPATFTTTIPTDYMDSMGHMNVMWYTYLFSQGFVGMMKQKDLSAMFDKTNNGGSFVLEAHLRYLSEVRVGHTINVHPRFISRSAKRFHVVYLMTNDDKQDVSATYEIVSSYVNLTERRTAAMPPDVASAMDRMIAAGQELSWEAPVCGTMSA